MSQLQFENKILNQNLTLFYSKFEFDVAKRLPHYYEYQNFYLGSLCLMKLVF